jgi:hypothetical protein
MFNASGNGKSLRLNQSTHPIFYSLFQTPNKLKNNLNSLQIH